MIAIGGTNIVKAFLGSTELANIAIGDELLLSSEEPLPYDAEVEYLETDGNAYIDTGLRLNQNAIVTMTFSTPTNIRGIAGYRYSAEVENVSVFAMKDQNDIQIDFGSYKSYRHTVPFQPYVMQTIRFSKTSLNENTYSWNGSNFTQRANFFLFRIAGNRTADMSNVTGVRIKEFEVDGLIKMKAVRVGQTGYMYDEISKTLHGNPGSGNFILGNDIT